MCKLRAKWVGSMVVFAVCLNPIAKAEELLVNGDFSLGDLGGWNTSTIGSGSFYWSQAGDLTPVSGRLTTGLGNPYTVSDTDGPGAAALAQTFMVPIDFDPLADTLTLSFDMFVNDWSGAGPLIHPSGLNHTAGPNQHARVDLLDPASAAIDPFLTNTGVIQNFYLGVDSTALPFPLTPYQFDLTSLVSAGQQYTLRFADVYNQYYLNMGIANVSVLHTDDTPPPVTLTTWLGGGHEHLGPASWDDNEQWNNGVPTPTASAMVLSGFASVQNQGEALSLRMGLADSTSDLEVTIESGATLSVVENIEILSGLLHVRDGGRVEAKNVTIETPSTDHRVFVEAGGTLAVSEHLGALSGELNIWGHVEAGELTIGGLSTFTYVIVEPNASLAVDGGITIVSGRLIGSGQVEAASLTIGGGEPSADPQVETYLLDVTGELRVISGYLGLGQHAQALTLMIGGGDPSSDRSQVAVWPQCTLDVADDVVIVAGTGQTASLGLQGGVNIGGGLYIGGTADEPVPSSSESFVMRYGEHPVLSVTNNVVVWSSSTPNTVNGLAANTTITPTVILKDNDPSTIAASPAELCGWTTVIGDVVVEEGRIAPGDTPNPSVAEGVSRNLGYITVDGDLCVTGIGEILLHIVQSRPSASYSDSLIVNGSIVLEPGAFLRLNVQHLNLLGYPLDNYVEGVEFDVLDVNSFDSEFSEIILPELNPGLWWDISDLYTTGVIRIIPEPASAQLFALGCLAAACLRSRGNRYGKQANRTKLFLPMRKVSMAGPLAFFLPCSLLVAVMTNSAHAEIPRVQIFSADFSQHPAIVNGCYEYLGLYGAYSSSAQAWYLNVPGSASSGVLGYEFLNDSDFILRIEHYASPSYYHPVDIRINRSFDLVTHYDPPNQDGWVTDEFIIPREDLTGINEVRIKLSSGATAGYYLSMITGWQYTITAPRVLNTTQQPSPAQTTLRTPSSNQLHIFTNGSVIDTSKPTIVLTHGWNSTPEASFGQMADQLALAGTEANIVAWDWSDDADTGPNLQGAAARAPRQGDALGEALLLTLGVDYSQTIHFVGHSLGARVNRQAVDTIHLNGLDWQKTQVTILDAAELGDLDRMPWDKSIPTEAAWIDNYISAFGSLHLEAANVILREGMPISIDPSALNLYEALESFHGYPVDWYTETVRRPTDSPMGNRWSFEGTGLNGSPGPGSAFVQTLASFDDELSLDSITWSQAESIILGRNTLYVGQGSLLALNAIRDGAVKAVGTVLTEVAEKIVDDTTEYTLRLILEEHSPAYAWVPITLPADAKMLSFDFLFDDVGNDDFLSFGIGDELLFAIEGNYILPNTLMNSGLLDISSYAGQDVELFFGFNSDGLAGGIMTIENIMFHSIPEPASVSLFGLSGVLLLVGNRRMPAVRRTATA